MVQFVLCKQIFFLGVFYLPELFSLSILLLNDRLVLGSPEGTLTAVAGTRGCRILPVILQQYDGNQ